MAVEVGAARDWPIECAICWENIQENTTGDLAPASLVRVIGESQMDVCTHIFHKQCIKPWLEDATHESTCPTCRRSADCIKVLNKSIEGLNRRWNVFSAEQFPPGVCDPFYPFYEELGQEEPNQNMDFFRIILVIWALATVFFYIPTQNIVFAGVLSASCIAGGFAGGFLGAAIVDWIEERC